LCSGNDLKREAKGDAMMQRFSVLKLSCVLTTALLALGCSSLQEPARAQNAAPPSASAPTQNYVWWEAETPKATNFPASTEFAPANEQEAAVLSQGRWIGTGGDRNQHCFLNTISRCRQLASIRSTLASSGNMGRSAGALITARGLKCATRLLLDEAPSSVCRRQLGGFGNR
jgi:hypothetical protein